MKRRSVFASTKNATSNCWVPSKGNAFYRTVSTIVWYPLYDISRSNWWDFQEQLLLFICSWISFGELEKNSKLKLKKNRLKMRVRRQLSWSLSDILLVSLFANLRLIGKDSSDETTNGNDVLQNNRAALWKVVRALWIVMRVLLCRELY